MKPSTRQRFAALKFDYPDPKLEATIVAHEASVTFDLAERLVGIATRSRALKNHGIDEGISTRMLIYAGVLIGSGVDPRESCDMTMTCAITDDPDITKALQGFVEAYFV
jgi:nitric oxide reductase NorQ protein